MGFYLLTLYNVVNILTTNREVGMCEQTEIAELQEIYLEMDAEGKKKMTVAAAQLLKVQKSFEENGRRGVTPSAKRLLYLKFAI